MANLATNSSALIVPPRPASTNAAGGMADIHDIRPPVEISDGWAWLGWVLLVLCVAAFGWWLWRWWQRRRGTVTAPTIIIPPHHRARQKLRAALELLDQPEPFCVAVSLAIREYLEERFDLHAPDRTTEEFLAELRSNAQLNAPHQALLGAFLERCDLVKFARYAPSRMELEDLLQSAQRLVDETVPEEPSPAGAMKTPAA